MIKPRRRSPKHATSRSIRRARQIEGYENQADQLKQQAAATAEKVAGEAKGTTSAAALGASISLLLGALAAFFGGRLGSVGLAPRLVSAD